MKKDIFSLVNQEVKKILEIDKLLTGWLEVEDSPLDYYRDSGDTNYRLLAIEVDTGRRNLLNCYCDKLYDLVPHLLTIPRNKDGLYKVFLLHIFKVVINLLTEQIKDDLESFEDHDDIDDIKELTDLLWSMQNRLNCTILEIMVDE